LESSCDFSKKIVCNLLLATRDNKYEISNNQILRIIIEKNRAYLDAGGIFIAPLPELKFISKS
jgi:hypothetical protein